MVLQRSLLYSDNEMLLQRNIDQIHLNRFDRDTLIPPLQQTHKKRRSLHGGSQNLPGWPNKDRPLHGPQGLLLSNILVQVQSQQCHHIQILWWHQVDLFVLLFPCLEQTSRRQMGVVPIQKVVEIILGLKCTRSYLITKVGRTRSLLKLYYPEVPYWIIVYPLQTHRNW